MGLNAIRNARSVINGSLMSWFVVLMFTGGSSASAQVSPTNKPPVDSTVFGKWPSVGNGTISHDGKFAFYWIRNLPATLAIRGTDSTFAQDISGASDAAFTPDSQQVVFLKNPDSLCILTLETSSTICIPSVRSFKLNQNRSAKRVAYQLLKPANTLVLRDLQTGVERSFPSVTDYAFSADGTTLVLQAESETDHSSPRSLTWLSVTDGSVSVIWRGAEAGNPTFDGGGDQLAFTGTAADRATPSLWLYKRGMKQAVLLVDGDSPGVGPNLALGKVERFSYDGTRIFIRLQRLQTRTPKPAAVPVDVWSYKDEKLQSVQLNDLSSGELGQGYLGVIGTDDHRIVRLQQDDEHLWLWGRAQFNDKVVLLLQTPGDPDEWVWNKYALTTVYLISTVDGSRTLLAEGVAKPLLESYAISPSGRYAVYYSDRQHGYVSYDLISRKTHMITRGVSATTWLTSASSDLPLRYKRPRGVAGWVTANATDDSALLYDRTDIWQVSLSHGEKAINLTNGYGRRHGMVFRLAMNGCCITPATSILVSAFDQRNKNDGFYRTAVLGRSDPERLIMGPYVFNGFDESTEDITYLKSRPVKARDADVYLVRRMTATESPNLFVTRDFTRFERISDVRPEQQYNWLKTRLLKWKLPDGRVVDGILYLPKDIDFTKKYPLIFYYYEKVSDALNAFIEPEASTGPINIPYFVSHGYLVFAPDMHYTVGHPGESVVNTIVSAAKRLAELPFVDSRRMGIEGHSRGGYETNFIITHTDLFAAAISNSGMSDYVNLYDGVRKRGISRQPAFEAGYQRIGASLWQRPELYVENSPVFKVDKVTTPLLMMSNKDDSDVPFEQGLQMFMALRRLGKKVWMLQYDGGDHMVFDRLADDLTTRMMQFFDHYLKGSPPPKWMTDGVPARLKGIESGLELDTSGKEP